MVVKPRIVIIGAGMAGLTAANKLYRIGASKELFELCVVEGGNRIGGRINSSELGGDRIELGATWIHGIEGSPIYKIAQEMQSLESQQPWECMDGHPRDPVTFAENGYKLNPSIVDPISTLFNKLMDVAQGNAVEDGIGSIKGDTGTEKLSVGSFLRKGLEAYCDSQQDQDDVKGCGNWNRKLLEEAIFAMHENFHRTYTAVNDLSNLDYKSESVLGMLPGKHISIAKGYSTIIESLASVLPTGLIQLGRKVTRIEWQPESRELENRVGTRPVMLYFDDGTTMFADHVIVTVSLGVLKAGICENSGLFNPPLPNSKIEAISRFGFGVVDKLFLQLSPTNEEEEGDFCKFPYLKLVYHQHDSELRQPEIPWWMRRTASVYPIYSKSRVLVTWFAGDEALEFESINDDDILAGVSATLSSFLANSQNSNPCERGIQSGNSVGSTYGGKLSFDKILKSQWGTDPLFLGSYSYVAVGSSVDDSDIMAEPLPKISASGPGTSPPLQILFAGEATDRAHFSTTHGAYFSGIREANRLLQHYNCIDV